MKKRTFARHISLYLMGYRKTLLSSKNWAMTSLQWISPESTLPLLKLFFSLIPDTRVYDRNHHQPLLL